MIRIDNSQVKILLADDTPVNLEIAGKVLAREGYDLHVADSGFASLDLIENIDFDLILMDVMMPGLDGYETCKRLREKEKNKSVPIIFLTAKSDIDSIVKGFELGAVDYIRKPFNGMELRARVKNHVELKKMREEIEAKNTRLQEAYEELEVLASTDPLTGLFNRREILERIEYERIKHKRNKRPFSLIIGDIDHFKRINDVYGHKYGDIVLVLIADLFKKNSREQDSICRWGGEEFMMLLPDTDKTGGGVYAEKLRAMIEIMPLSFDEELQITMTFGVSCVKIGQSVDELIAEADYALYEGKKNGRNCVFPSPPSSDDV